LIELSKNISEYIRNNFGEEFFINYFDYFHDEYKPYLRISPFTNAQKLIIQLNCYGIEVEAVENIPNAYRIISGSEFAGKTFEYILGKYYLQSLSSMMPPLILNPGPEDVVLDLCAAPGSKTTELAELMNNRGTLIANESALERLKSLVFNIDKMNFVNIGVFHGKGELLSKSFENYFDKILIDAPCSALGITQKRGEVSNWWDVKKALAMSDLQLRLLISAVKMCKVGGEMVYSTCTLTFEENELVINKFLKKYPVELINMELPVKSINGFTKYGDDLLNPEVSKTRRILPWEVQSEGFFIAKLRKIDEMEKSFIFYKEKRLELVKAISGKIKNYLEVLSEYFGIPIGEFDKYKYLIKNGDIFFVDKDWHSQFLDSFNRIGIKLGQIDKRGILQLHSLAAQVFEKSITKNIVQLENLAELDNYFSGGTIKKHFEIGGQRVVKFENYLLGTAVASKDGLKSQFPRAFRTQEIIYPEMKKGG
jgi:16S rRNA (cytosine1407-C5)-methyltransferase